MRGFAGAVFSVLFVCLSAPSSAQEWQAAPDIRALPEEIPDVPIQENEIAPDDTAGVEVDPQAVLARLALKMPLDLVPYFDTFLYVSKAKSGPWAQHMFVFARDAAGGLAFRESFAISTGRERQERYFTHTPSGFFTLDPSRFYRMVRSDKWDGAAMPYAMFFDYSYRTVKSGLALHAAVGRSGVRQLGSRASGGCIRMPPDQARALFERLSSAPRTQVPVLEFDHQSGTTNREGRIQRDAYGRPILKSGVGVLIFIDEYGGDGAQIAALR